MNQKYLLDTKENRQFLRENAEALLTFGHHFPSPKGSSYYLSDNGMPWTERNRETWITARMAHVYSVGTLLHHNGSEALVDAALSGIKYELHDDENGGWYAGLTKDDTPLPDKQCYAHAFVILAATSAMLAQRDGAEELLHDALAIYDEKFWCEEDGLAIDTWNTEFTVPDDYRGVNANMHTVEAFLAVADVTGNDLYRFRAGRIIDHVISWAKDNAYRIPEHFTADWKPDLEKNIETPDDPFKPYGATPGHGIEWARLITQWATSTYHITTLSDCDSSAPTASAHFKNYIDIACRLFDRAIADAWHVDETPGIVYTTDWNGQAVVHDRMHWTLAEAINTSAVLYRVTGRKAYADLYAQFLEYLDTTVLDHSCGSWFHQLDRNNKLMTSVWPGKSDIYHALQAMLIPYMPVDLSIAAACRNRYEGS